MNQRYINLPEGCVATDELGRTITFWEGESDLPVVHSNPQEVTIRAYGEEYVVARTELAL